MKFSNAVLSLVCAAVMLPASGVSVAQMPALLSPWDAGKVAEHNLPYSCPALTQIAPDLTTDGFYADNDPTHSIIDPVKMKAYTESSGPVKKEGDVVVAAADAYRSTGSVAAAQCALDHILNDARNRSLAGKMSSSQAYFVQGWVAGAEAIAFLKIRNSSVVKPEHTQAIGPWLKAVSAQTRDYYDQRTTKGGIESQNNHLYWAGVQLAAVGIVANDRTYYDWAIQAAKGGIAQIREDGSLPQEMRRGKRALHYHLYAAAPLVAIAEFGMPNGTDLYAFHDGALKRLAVLSASGLVNPEFFAKGTGIEQEVPRPPTGEAIGWAKPYNRRFPNPTITRLLAECNNLSYMYSGGLPPN